MSAVLDYLPRGNTLSDEVWHRRHVFLQWVLGLHIPALFIFGVLRGFAAGDVLETLALPTACLIIGHLLRSRRLAATAITLGLVYCSAALVGLSDGAIEAHFHFFITIGFIALYQDWVPFLLNILFTVFSHGIGSSFVPDLMFNHASAQEHPWEWSLIHGAAVLAACVGVVVFWKSTEDEQNRSLTLTKQLADAEIGRRRFTSDLLVNLARRNQNLLYRQLELLNDLEDKERDPDALAHLFRLDHLATRIRRNAESLLVLSGEESPRTWREPVALVDVMRAAIAEIEDLDRVDDAIDETLSVSGRSVADLTHLFAELLENAVRFSPPGVMVVVRSRPLAAAAGTQLVTIEDWGVGMTPAEMAEANEILAAPRDVDLSVSQRLGLHVLARLAHRYGIRVELTPTPGGGVTAVATLPASIFQRQAELVGAASGAQLVAAGAGRTDRDGADFGAGFGIDFGPADGSGARDPGHRPTALTGTRNGAPSGSAPNGAAPNGSGPRGMVPTGAAPTGVVPQGTASHNGASNGAGPYGGSVNGGAQRGAPGGSATVLPGAAPRPARPVPPLPADPIDDPTAGLPRRDPGSAGPRRDSGYAGPQRQSGPDFPQRESGPDFPQRESGPDFPQRQSGPDFPQRQSGPDFPQRESGPGLRQREPGAAFPHREAAGEPRRDGGEFAQRGGDAARDGMSGLPRRAPGGSLPQGRQPRNGAEADRETQPPNGTAERPDMSRLPEPFHSPAGGDGATQSGYGPGDGWSSWWTRATQPTRPTQAEPPQPQPQPRAEPQPRPEPRPEPDPDPGPEPVPNGSTPAPLPEPRPPADEDGPQLRRRVPQAHLAAGLRRDAEQQAPEETPVVRDPLTARTALSRFQAAQRAAREAVDDERAGPE